MNVLGRLEKKFISIVIAKTHLVGKIQIIDIII